MEIKEHVVSLGKLVDDSKRMLASSVRPGVQLVTVKDVLQEEDWVLGDAHRIQQVLTNVVTNAIKYTQEGSITLRVSWIHMSMDDRCSWYASAACMSLASASPTTIWVAERDPAMPTQYLINDLAAARQALDQPRALTCSQGRGSPPSRRPRFICRPYWPLCGPPPQGGALRDSCSGSGIRCWFEYWFEDACQEWLQA